MEQVAWTRFHLRDLESDMSVFHRVDDVYAMPAPRFFAFAYRIAAYDGMLARRIEAENEQPSARRVNKELRRGGGTAPARRESGARGDTARASAPGRMPMADKSARVVPFAAFAAMHPGLIERSRAPRDGDDASSTPSD